MNTINSIKTLRRLEEQVPVPQQANPGAQAAEAAASGAAVPGEVNAVVSQLSKLFEPLNQRLDTLTQSIEQIKAGGNDAQGSGNTEAPAEGNQGQSSSDAGSNQQSSGEGEQQPEQNGGNQQPAQETSNEQQTQEQVQEFLKGYNPRLREADDFGISEMIEPADFKKNPPVTGARRRGEEIDEAVFCWMDKFMNGNDKMKLEDAAKRTARLASHFYKKKLDVYDVIEMHDNFIKDHTNY